MAEVLEHYSAHDFPTLFFNLITLSIGSFQVFTCIVMTSGGPVNSTLFYVFYLYRMAFETCVWAMLPLA